MQIRAALAIVVFLVGLKYITNKNLKKYTIISIIVYSLHHSLLIAIPQYFINKLKIKKKHIVIGLLIAFVIAGFYSAFIRNAIQNYNVEKDLISATYTADNGEYSIGQGLLNPMIYYQVIILLLFTFKEKELINLTQHYFTIRNAYFVSTLILITLSSFSALSGRGSTTFATLDIIIVPTFLRLLPKNMRFLGVLAIVVIYIQLYFIQIFTQSYYKKTKMITGR